MRPFLIVAGLFVVSFGASWLAIQDFRAGGARPYFYQSNFEPAVMMACGRGFGLSQPPPVALVEFLHEGRDTFDCAELKSAARIPLTAAAHANWYYLYAATAAVWRVTGISWLAVDYLVALMAAVTTVLVFGLFRQVSPTGPSAILALLLSLSTANLTQLLSLRDYSKAPFALAALLLLAVLVLRPMTVAATLAVAAAYGAVAGIGYGFRGDLAIMVPFGAVMVLLFLPGAWRAHWVRNGLAGASLVAAFSLAAFPVLKGLDKGGCQFHVALLGLTTPLTEELALSPPIYRFGDALTDTFTILKVGDYASRVLHAPLPGYCDADYDKASGHLYMDMAATFPADLAVRAYRSVWTILRQGLEIPSLVQPAPPFASTVAPAVYRFLNRVTGAIAPVGPLLTLAALILAFATSFRVGLALSVSVLFLTGYPAIQFEGRHWFHLRFIPWWSGAFVVTQMIRRREHDWTWRTLGTGAAATAGLLIALAAALMAIRAVQARSVVRLLAQYESATAAPLESASRDGGVTEVSWTPVEYGNPADRRGSDLLVATLSTSQCAGAGPLTLKVRYQAASSFLDLSTELTVPRPSAAAPPTRVFLPVFWSATSAETSQRFTSLETLGAPATCVESVARVVDAADWPLWLQVVLPPDWRTYPLYQSMRLPRRFNTPVSGDSQ